MPRTYTYMNTYSNINNNNTQTCKAPYGSSFRGAGDRWRVTVSRLA